jgi:lysophospholipid acyltransferase (LPLAT)-like uncharacterized protein
MIAAAAAGWGRLLGRYGLKTVNARSVRLTTEARLPPAPTIFVCWHEHNLIALAVHRLMRKGPVFTLVPKGVRGAAMAGWVATSGATALAVAGDAQDGLQLRRMAKGLRNGGDVLIAVDGPAGPRRRVRPGALWLAEATGAPVVAFSCAARPAFRFPRWDRHLVPLPGARIAAAASAPITVRRGERDGAEEHLASVLADLSARAATELGSFVGGQGAPVQPEGAPWK